MRLRQGLPASTDLIFRASMQFSTQICGGTKPRVVDSAQMQTRSLVDCFVVTYGAVMPVLTWIRLNDLSRTISERPMSLTLKQEAGVASNCSAHDALCHTHARRADAASLRMAPKRIDVPIGPPISQDDCPLFKLPAELRNYVWELALAVEPDKHDRVEIRLARSRARKPSVLMILGTCRLINQEAAGMFISHYLMHRPSEHWRRCSACSHLSRIMLANSNLLHDTGLNAELMREIQT